MPTRNSRSATSINEGNGLRGTGYGAMLQMKLRLALVDFSDGEAELCHRALGRLSGLSVDAIVHRDHAICDQIGARFELPERFYSLPQLLDSAMEAVDAVLIHGPRADRQQLVRQALEAGKHVLVQSPWATALRDAASLMALADQQRRQLMVGGVDRYRPSVQAIQQAARSGQLGMPVLLRMHDWRPPDPSQGSIWDRATDLLDTACWLFDAVPTDIAVLGQPQSTGAGEPPDFLQIHLGFPPQGMALLSVANGLPAGAGYRCVTLIGSSGAAYADDHDQMQLLLQGGAATARRAGEELATMTTQLREFQRAVHCGERPETKCEGCGLAIELTDTAMRAWSIGQPVRFERTGHGSRT